MEYVPHNGIVGDHPDFAKMIDLFNTWSCFFLMETLSNKNLRYQGTRSDAIEKDTINLGKAIVDYINKGNEPTVGMTFFLQDVKRTEAYYAGYKNTMGWFQEDVEHPIHIEHAFFKMLDLFDVISIKKAMDSIGIIGSLN